MVYSLRSTVYGSCGSVRATNFFFFEKLAQKIKIPVYQPTVQVPLLFSSSKLM